MTDQRFWWLIPQIERNYFDFFLKRGYIPAIAYMQSILDVVHYSMVRGNPQTHLFNRHRYIYYVLDRFPSSHTGDVFIKQLGKLVHVERGSLFSNEMKAAGEYAVKHALSLEQKEEINRHLIQVLESIRSEVQTDTAAARTDFVIRIDIIKLLGKTGTETSARALIMEMDQTVHSREKRTYATLAELATIQEFYSYMENFFPDGPSRVFETAGHIAEFRHSTGDKKSAAAEKLLHSEFLLYKREAVRHLIGQNEIEILRKHFPVNALFLLTSAEMMAVYSESPVGMIILLEARRKGLRVEQTSEGIQFRKK